MSPRWYIYHCNNERYIPRPLAYSHAARAHANIIGRLLGTLASFPGRVDSKNNTADLQLNFVLLKKKSAWEQG